MRIKVGKLCRKCIIRFLKQPKYLHHSPRLFEQKQEIVNLLNKRPKAAFTIWQKNNFRKIQISIFKNPAFTGLAAILGEMSFTNGFFLY